MQVCQNLKEEGNKYQVVACCSIIPDVVCCFFFCFLDRAICCCIQKELPPPTKLFHNSQLFVLGIHSSVNRFRFEYFCNWNLYAVIEEGKKDGWWVLWKNKIKEQAFEIKKEIYVAVGIFSRWYNQNYIMYREIALWIYNSWTCNYRSPTGLIRIAWFVLFVFSCYPIYLKRTPYAYCWRKKNTFKKSFWEWLLSVSVMFNNLYKHLLHYDFNNSVAVAALKAFTWVLFLYITG